MNCDKRVRGTCLRDELCDTWFASPGPDGRALESFLRWCDRDSFQLRVYRILLFFFVLVFRVVFPVACARTLDEGRCSFLTYGKVEHHYELSRLKIKLDVTESA